VPAVVEFYDIAGLVKGASQGEGLGNKFLSHIREVATIVHVVRLFEDGNVIHVGNKVDPADDMKTIEAELILADLATLDKQKEPRMNASKDDLFLWETVKYLKSELDKGVPARAVTLTNEQQEMVKQLSLLTIKPVLYVFNVSESQLENQEELKKKIVTLLNCSTRLPASQRGEPDGQVANNTAIKQYNNYIYLNAKLENDVLALTETEQKEYLKQYHLEETGLDRLIKKAYENLSLISFLTAGELEARAWTIRKGTLAPQAAGVIHTDFEKKFIKADVIPYSQFVSAGGWVKARESGKVQIVGRDYEMGDGDVVEFKIGA